MIDPSIALQVKSPQFENPLEVYARGMSLKNIMRQGQMQDLQLQEAREQQADQERIRKAYMDSSGDLNDFMAKARQYGASPDAVLKVQQGILTQKEALLKMGKEEREEHLAKADQIRAMLIPIDEEKDDTRAAQMFAQTYIAAEKQGLVDDQSKQLLRQLMPQGFTRDGLRLLKSSLTTGTQLLKEANEADKTTANLMRANIAQQRADSYERNIEALINYRPEQIKIRREFLAAQIERDENLDEYRRDALRQQLEIVDRQIAGARERQERAGEQAMERTRYTQGEISARSSRVQDAITQRQMQKGQTGPQALRITEAAIRVASKLPGFGDLSEEDQISAINTLIDSGIGNVQPVVTPGEHRGPLQKVGDALGVTEAPSRTIVKPGAPIAPSAGRGTAPPQPQQKVTTRAKVQEYATANGIDYATAEAAFKAKGYTIVER